MNKRSIVVNFKGKTKKFVSTHLYILVPEISEVFEGRQNSQMSLVYST